MNRLAQLFRSKSFKRAVLIAGILFFVATIFISLDPQPFLKYGYGGVFLFNLVGPGTLLIPSLAQHMNIFALAFASALGMVLNDSVSFVVGKSGDVIIPRTGKVGKIENSLHAYGFFAFFFWSLLPLPYDIIGLIGGYLEFSYRSFFIPMFLGKFVRFVLLGMAAIAVFGAL